MNQQQIKEKLRKFLDENSQRTLVLKGRWGVGKTHFWREFIYDYQSSNAPNQNFKLPFCKNAGARSYAYVSLFGVSSLNELRGRILSSAGGVKGFAVGAGKMLGPLVQKGVSLNIPSIVSGWLTETLIKNFIICFDDLERKNPQLKLEEVLGLIDYLKNEKGCHCIVVFNEDELKDEAEKLKKYREKVVDVELTFNPSLDRNFSIAFKNFKNGVEKDAILHVFSKLQRTNIRTMLRVSWMLEAFSPLLSSFEEHLRAQLVRQMTMLAVFYYENGDLFVLEDLKNAHWLAMQLSDRMDSKNGKKDDVDPKELAFQELIYRAEFTPHDLDPVFYQYLADGFVDQGKAKALIEKWSKNVERQKVQMAFQELQEATWGGYWMSEENFFSKVEALLNEHLKNLTFDEYTGLITFAIKIRSNFPKAEWDIKFADGKIEWLDLDQIASFETLHITNDQKQKLEQRRQQLLKEKPLEQVIEKLCTGDSWSPSDFRYIDAYTRDELFAYFTAEINHRGASEISILADRLRSLTKDYELSVARKLKSILDQLSARSTLDALRTNKAMKRIDLVLQEAERFQVETNLVANSG